MNNKISSLLERKLHLDGGFTFDVKAKNFTSTGFVVSPFKRLELQIPLENFIPRIITDYVNHNVILLERENHFLGGWIDNPTVYLDVCIVVPGLIQAYFIGVTNEQIAIFCLDNFTEYRLQDLLISTGHN